ncbi:MAG: type II secretion system protein [Caulobacter sp.]|nr:type II secretion system protein [Caulobacter sp.]
MKNGFSLVELSIVLVILGLLTGGILAGKSLIRASELRSVSTDVQRYITATQAFRDKYFYIPGDLPNATSFWGTLGGNSSDNYSYTCGLAPTTISQPLTCNGDGDGSTLYIVGTTGYVYERFRFWQHLANSGLIEGQYAGCNSTVCGLAVSGLTAGINVPAAKMGNSAFFHAAQYNGTGATSCCGGFAGTTSIFALDTGKNMLLLTRTASPAAPDTLPLRPEEAWNIDLKMDDGLPGTGKVASNKGDTTNNPCTTMAGVAAGADSGAAYNLPDSNRDCLLFFLRAF